MNSRFSHWLGRHACLTLDKLMSAFEKCYHPTPTAIKTTHLYNVTEWLDGKIENIRGQSRPHAFKIKANEEGRAELFWKKWATDKVIKDMSYLHYIKFITLYTYGIPSLTHKILCTTIPYHFISTLLNDNFDFDVSFANDVIIGVAK